jgi:hypothetical protein
LGGGSREAASIEEPLLSLAENWQGVCAFGVRPVTPPVASDHIRTAVPVRLDSPTAATAHLNVQLIRQPRGAFGEEHDEWLGCDRTKEDASRRLARRCLQKHNAATTPEMLRPDVKIPTPFMDERGSLRRCEDSHLS